MDNLSFKYEQTKYMLKQKIKKLFANEYSGHDYWHSIRVLNTAEKISKTEECNKYIVMIAALLHDTDDIKIFETTDYENARRIMSECLLTEDTIDQVIDIIKEISFKGTDTTSPKSIEGKIVQDADRLDAMGAIGIARAFAYGGNHNRAIYIPDCQPHINMDETEYRNNKGTTINHFYEKLLLIKDMMNTDCAKIIAEKRDGYMRGFLKEFYEEWNEQ
ncbi:HD domain-containing protein [Lachnospiraceae bacterium]|nr:HD domain-containing protein [uncultured Schaedlerella sp.]NBI58957.1 HD domain-containing protein [Lachnospiraceae bacterium]